MCSFWRGRYRLGLLLRSFGFLGAGFLVWVWVIEFLYAGEKFKGGVGSDTWELFFDAVDGSGLFV